MKGDKKIGWKEVRREERNLCARKRYRQKEENKKEREEERLH